jgi:phytoene desaturase
MKKNIHIIGAGFSSLAASCYLAKAGFSVTVFEKNAQLGGRARQLKKEGFSFDMGPTWYWMPDVFERFFSDFDKHPSDFYQLDKLAPAYEVYFGKEDSIVIPDSLEEIYQVFEAEEPGSSVFLKKFLDTAKGNYEVAVKNLVYRPGLSPLELISKDTILRLDQVFNSIRKEVGKRIKSPKLIKILEFPVLFLGAKPQNTPALYSFMNWADFGLGTWHPKGGMVEVVNGMVALAKSLGVEFRTNANIDSIEISSDNQVEGLRVNGKVIPADIVLSGADYHHTESLLPKHLRQYSDSYWNSRTFAPSALLFYVGLNKKLKNVSHHSLFFDTEFDEHAKKIYDDKGWPENPLFYASFPSISDNSFAPEGKEAATFLIPLATDLDDSSERRDYYYELIMDRLEKITKQDVRDHVVFCESFCVSDFKSDYNSFGGNAYGLANTLGQTAFLRPKIKSKKVKNLFFSGQLTVPGPGVPPALISGKIASDLIIKSQLR